jgi:hypothetical protein
MMINWHNVGPITTNLRTTDVPFHDRMFER